ncbi:YdcF family protein [Butyrivibrio sp. FCS014]|uniref:YdcF family protein n=2 Tax=Butyrivibrio sp. FCS014 TaxID=1408304 RepID=UPI000467D278|nr:YdcF family protein [Butyrivibrio sp. FCS014]
MKKLFTQKIRILWFFLSILCLGYSLMVYLVGSGTLSFTIWLAGAAFFALCCFLAGEKRWSKVPKAVRYAAYIALAVFASVFMTCQIAILSHFFDKGESDLDYIIVLGAQMRESGPSVIYRYRLEKAYQYLSENPDTICITTGGAGINENISEGMGGKKYLVKLGISESRILAEETSRDTGENIQNALLLVRAEDVAEDNLKIGIVTNGFHVFRGVRIAKKNTEARVCGIAAYMQPRFIPNNMVRECFGILRDLINGELY